MNVLLEKFTFTPELTEIINNSPSVIVPDSKETLYELIFGNEHTDKIEVLYDEREACERGHGGPLQKWCCGQLYGGLHAPPGPRLYAHRR